MDEDIEARTALKTYLLEAHGRMRTDALATLRALGAGLGITVEPTHEPELLALSLGELNLWMDISLGRVFKLYTVGVAKDADRVHELLVAGSGLLECLWIPSRSLEALVRAAETRMVLFSLRHDRRALRREPDEAGIDSVTLRFWGPKARETLEKLRGSAVLPSATSVHSVRVRAGDDERYCLAEAFHNGKITAVGTSFAEHERLVRAILDEHEARTLVLEPSARAPRKVVVPVAWTVDDLGYAVARMFSGAEPFRFWGLPEQTGPETYRVRAVDTDVGRAAVFEVSAQGVTVELNPRAPASVVTRFVSLLQYHVNADVATEALEPEPLLQLCLPEAQEPGAFEERSLLPEVARSVLAEACAAWVRGTLALTTHTVLEQTHGGMSSDALHDLTRRVLSEAAAHEWRPWLKLVVSPEGRASWRFSEALASDSVLRARELSKLNRAGQQLVARLSGTAIARWLQLSLFGPESMVAPLAEDDGLPG
jgi:hypothetical protein